MSLKNKRKWWYERKLLILYKYEFHGYSLKLWDLVKLKTDNIYTIKNKLLQMLSKLIPT